MNVAVILTGHLRCWKEVFPNFKEKIIDRYDPDIFIHTWDEEGWWIPGDKPNEKGYFENSPKIDQKEVLDAYNPRGMTIETWDKYDKMFERRGELFKNYAHQPKNILSMFYKLNRGVTLLEDYVSQTGTHYDLIIRMRPDMILHEDLPEFDTNYFYTLTHRNHLGQGTGDMIHVGNMFDMLIFSKISCYINQLYFQTDLLCPHVLSTKYIGNVGLPWKEFMINKTIQHTPNEHYKETQ
jgi:hypothetical protein